MKTLAVRVRYQNESALKIARFLEGHPSVRQVNYPGLESSPDHLRACELLDGFGGMLSFELEGGVVAADSFIDRVTLPISAPSLGGVESLITRPATTSHSGYDVRGTLARRNRGRIDTAIRWARSDRGSDRGLYARPCHCLSLTHRYAFHPRGALHAPLFA